MVTNRPPAIVTFVFLAIAAGWIVADRYAGFGIYGVAGEAVELVLAFLVIFPFAAVIAASLIRSWRAKAVEWMTVATAIALLLVAEVAWRVIIAPLPMNGFKAAALVMDLATPLIALLGFAAAITEWRSLTYRSQTGETATA